MLTDKDGYKSVDYLRLTPILVEAIKELNIKTIAQQKTNDLQQKLIEDQQKKIEKILKEIEALNKK